MSKFNYNWNLADAIFTKDKGKVFSCFACGGGSTMGYKLAGFDVLGFNEIDPKLAAAYIENHKPKYAFIEPIQSFKNREDLPADLYDLDILDGSPPCSSFSMSGNRGKDWGKEKHFREGQAKQVLDTLFFDFIDLAEKLQPKVVIAENVKSLLMGAAKSYVREIYKAFDAAGYHLQHFVFDASKMGVPQRRERVFFIALRKDLAAQFLQRVDFFTMLPKINLAFNEREIPYSDLETIELGYKAPLSAIRLLEKCKAGDCCNLYHEKGHFSNYSMIDKTKPLRTITASFKRSSCGEFKKVDNTWYGISVKEALLCQSFPQDYNFCKTEPYYLIGMSVPPICTANIASEIHTQWLAKM